MVVIKKPKFFDDFKAFISKGNVLDMAVGIIIGIAFGAVINSAVNDLIMPPIGYLLGGVDFQDWFFVLKDGPTTPGPYDSLQAAKDAGAVTFRFGVFINTLINFLIIAFVVFIIVKMVASRARKEEAKTPTTRACPFCDSQISLKAKRCPNCTSEVPPEKKEEPKPEKKKPQKPVEEEEEDEEDDEDEDEVEE